MNRTPPQPEIVGESLDISAELLAVIGTLARTYEAQRLRLLERAGECGSAPSPLRPLNILEPDVRLDGHALSASIVDAVTMAGEFAGQSVALPLLLGSEELMAAEAGWWDALLGDIERRIGLPPRAVSISLPAHTPESVRANFAERVTR
jgi:hypothetical protein